MTEVVLKLIDLTKIYILGDHKSAKRTQKEIVKLHRRYEAVCERGTEEIKRIEKTLVKAQGLFEKEKYPEAYKLLTGKELPKSNDKGVVVHALNGVDIEIKKGEIVAIVGPSGSGKSTLLNMLGLLDTPTTGRIYLGGKDVTQIKKSKLPAVRSKELGFVFQSFNLIPSLTALENVMLPLKYTKTPPVERRKRAVAALERVGLSDRMRHTPNELSGGQRQRVAIARSLVNEPAIIFGDELTGELDTKTTKEVMDLLLKLNKKSGQTFIVVTHNPEVAKVCHRIIEMRDGKVVKS
jgi:putative ABC transport system ATP-binding protein